jgi:ubiquinone biosynthesis protein
MLGAFDLGGPSIPYIGIAVVPFIGFMLSMLLAALLFVAIFRGGRL